MAAKGRAKLPLGRSAWSRADEVLRLDWFRAGDPAFICSTPIHRNASFSARRTEHGIRVG